MTAKRKSYGGEKGDIRRKLPRKKWKGYKGPWPPPEEAATPSAGNGANANAPESDQ